MRTRQNSFFRLGLILFIAALVVSCALPSLGGDDEAEQFSEQGDVNEIVQASTATETLLPPPTQTAAPSNTPWPTDPPLPTSTPRPSPTIAPKDFYLEEFEDSLDDWELIFMSGDAELADVYNQDGRLTFYLDGEDIYAYAMYDAYYYSDVSLTAVVENRGYNNNNISLICRFDPDEGWYEFNIANNGLYNIYFFDVNEYAYQFLANGGSTAINMGKAINEYKIVCQGEKLILYINGVETKRYVERKYVLKEGMIGVSVSSFNVYPIEVDFLSLDISEP